jgi:hypothetical protein
MSNMAGVVKETGTDCPSRTSEFTPGFWWGLCSSSFEFSALCFSPSSCVLYCQFHWIVLQYTGRRGNLEWTIQWNWQYNTQDEGAIPNGRSSETDSTIHRTKGQTPVYCTVSFNGSSIQDCPFVLCIVLSVLLDRPYGIAPSSCVLYCQFHWIVHSGLPLRQDEGAIPNGRSSETDSTIHRTKGQSRMDDPVKLTVQYTGRRGNPVWTIK